MFFDLIRRNSRRSRRENGLLFVTLLAAIVAFYMLLSLRQQDVVVFLTTLESDAVRRLLQMIPLFYGLTLALLFALVYFASKLYLERRSHEFGMYLMLGMPRRKLFFLLLLEDLRTSAIALLTGLPIALLLAELTSLVTARLVGLGIIGHRFSVSLSGILGTAAGFLLIKLLSFLLLSGKLARRGIDSLLSPTPEGAKPARPKWLHLTSLTMGLILLACAYGLAIFGAAWQDIAVMALTLLLGVLGIFLLFFGLQPVLSKLAQRGKKPLHTFTFRQLQEIVVRRSGSLSVSSLLILAALCCFGCGVAISLYYGQSEPHTLDYTFPEQTAAEVEQQLEAKQLNGLFSGLFEVRTGYIRTSKDYDHALTLDSVTEALSQQPASAERNTLLQTLSYAGYPHLISLSGYNALLSAAGLPELRLQHGEAGVYMDTEFTSPQRTAMLNQVLAGCPQVTLSGQEYRLVGTVQSTNLVVDRAITLSFALILPDEDFAYFTMGDSSVYTSGILASDQSGSLLTAISETNRLLDQAELYYESYLQNMGRQLFYIVAASYITMYLAIIFLLIANTTLSVQFLTQQRKTTRRYLSLVRLGASYETLRDSLRRQLRWYLGIPVLVAAVSSPFGVRALFSGMLQSRVRNDIPTLIGISAAMIFLLCVVEWLYLAAVERSGSRYLLTLMQPQREE